MYNFRLGNFDIYHIVLYFIIFSFLGWLMETIRVSLRNKRYINRGFVAGPVCPIYGIGMIFIILFLSKFKNNLILLIFCGTILSTVLEYITSYLLEVIFNAKWWDYSYRKHHIKGRVCLDISCAWGVLSLIMIKLVVPIIDIIIEKIPFNIGVIFINIFFVLFFIDLAYTVYSLLSLKNFLTAVKELLLEIKEYILEISQHIRYENMKGNFKNLVMEYIKERKNNIKEDLSIKLSDFIEKYTDFEDTKDRHNILDKLSKLKQKYHDIFVKYVGFTYKRIFIAFSRFQVRDIEINKVIKDLKDRLNNHT